MARPAPKAEGEQDKTPQNIDSNYSSAKYLTAMPSVHKFALVALTLLSASGQGNSFVPTTTSADSHHHNTRAASRLEFQSDDNNYASEDNVSRTSSTAGGLSSLSVTELKRILSERGVDFRDCLEKRDLIDRLVQTNENVSTGVGNHRYRRQRAILVRRRHDWSTPSTPYRPVWPTSNPCRSVPDRCRCRERRFRRGLEVDFCGTIRAMW